MRLSRFFPPIPVVVPPGLNDDERLLAAWSALPDPNVWSGQVDTVRHARQRLLVLRRASEARA